MTANAQRWSWPALIGLTLVQVWAAHAVVFFAHEYAHSFTAWALGWKTNPLGLDYAHPTLTVFLIQLGIDQNVAEGPIFASGRSIDAAIIAGAGMVLGNGLITLPLSRLLWRRATSRRQPGWAMFAHWCTLASVGNLLAYVPIRTFTHRDDMGSVEKGFGWSPWIVVVLLGTPTLLALVWFFLRAVPDAMEWLFPQSRARRYLLATLTCGFMFGFYGAVGFLNDAPSARMMSSLAVLIALPLTLVFELILLRQNSPRRTTLNHI